MVTKPLILLPIFLFHTTFGFPKKIPIVGLFDQDEEILDMFEASVKAVNKDGLEDEDVFLTPIIEEIKADAYEASSKVCEQLKLGIVGIFGPHDKVIAEHVQSICNTIEVPHISVRQDLDLSQPRGLGLNVYPHISSLSRLYNQLVTEFKWKSFAILYEDTDSLIRIRPLLERWDAHGTSAFMYHLGYGPNYRQGMQEIKASRIDNIIIDCSYEILDDVLNQAQQVGILSDKYKVIVTSLDLQTLDLEPYQYSGVNFTGLRLIDPEDPTVLKILDRHKKEWDLDDPSQLRVEPALMYDAVQLFAIAFKQLKDAIKGDIRALPCNGTVRWEHGLSLSNFLRSNTNENTEIAVILPTQHTLSEGRPTDKVKYLNNRRTSSGPSISGGYPADAQVSLRISCAVWTETRGLTGLVKFDKDGFRSNIELDILRLTENGLIKIGEWNSTAGENIDWLPEISTLKSDVRSIQNKTFIVLISLTPPYGMEKESIDKLSGNERYEGFSVDIIQELSKMLEFNYTFQVEKNYGSLNNNTGKWSGMLGKIIAGEADLAITDLTITADRQDYVDFTNPIMNLGISILYKKPTKAAPSLFSFLLPFSNAVWYYLIGSYIIVSLLLFAIGRLCPAEWNNPYPCIEEAEVLQNQFTCKNACWFAIGSIMQQGSEIAPIGISTRMVASCWWFFCLIMVSSYTANLAACLTVESSASPFDDVEGLAKSKTIKYGAKANGSTFNFFRDSNIEVYQEMYKNMVANKKEVLVDDNKVGIQMAEEGDYAFLMESATIEYEIERHCTLTQIGGLLDEKGYGIAIKKNSKYLHDINTAVLQMSEGGTIQIIKKKWWTQKRGGGKCQESQSSVAQALKLDNVGGVFLVLTIGIALSCVYTIFELLWDVAQTSIRENVPFKQELINELKFIVKCSGSKPVQRKNGLSSKSENGSTRECTPPYGFIPTVIRTSPTNDK